MPRTLAFGLAVLCIACSLGGCASTGLFSFARDSFPKAGPKNPPIGILGLWKAGEGPGIESRTSRGFSGQIMFFARNAREPIQVDGGVRIYVFDDQGSADDQVKPFHEFNFTPGAWKAHLTKGALGATYDVFIPYTRPGIHEAKCSLRVKFTAKDGSELYSEMVNLVLPGVKKKGSAAPDLEAQPGGEGDGAADSAMNDLVRKTEARNRTMTRTLPTPEEIQKMVNRKPVAEELTAAQRRRIMRETLARLKSENRSGVVLAAYEEPPDEEGLAESKASGRRSLIQADYDQPTEAGEIDPNSVAYPGGKRGKNPLED
jgi:hypothetical protein